MTTAFDPGFRVVPEPSEQVLTERQLVDYRAHRERLLEWALTLGKNPDHAEGYAQTTVHGRAYRLDQFYRWVWSEFDGYTTDITHEHADAWTRELAFGDDSQAHKAAHQKSIKMLFRWRAWEFGDDEWEPDVHFSSNYGASNPKDYLTKEERRRIREASLEFGGVPSYNALTPDERDRWKIHLAQRFEIPKRDVGPEEFKRANSWKVPSLMWTALDAGLRPVEVERATVRWVDVSNQMLRIPREESAKSFDNWAVSLTARTANALERWLVERDQYEKYEDTDALWLNRAGNPYKHHTLNRLFRKVCEAARVPSDGRTFYAIRHSVGTYMVREEDLAAAQAQLRHKSPLTTMRYDQAPVEDRREALDRMG